MAGTYTGPYPTREEAQNLLADGGQEFQARDLLRDRVTIDDAQIALDEGVGKGILSMLDERHADSSYRLFHAGLIERLATAAIVQQRCLVLRIPVRSRNANAAGDSALLVLIDLQCGRPFAYYSEKEFIWQGGPVPWKRPELR